MPVQKDVLREEIRLQSQRLRRIPAGRIKADTDLYRKHAPTRPGDAGRVFDAIVSLGTGGGPLVSHRALSAKVADDIRGLSYNDTLMWLSELEGTVNRAPQPMSDEAAAALRGTLNLIRGHISDLEAQAR